MEQDKKRIEVNAVKDREALYVEFHNPNSQEETVRWIVRLFCEINREKIEKHFQKGEEKG